MTRALSLARAFLLLLLLAPVPLHAGEPERVRFGRFGEVRLYHPAPDSARVVILLSGDDGWDAPVVELARTLAKHDVLVSGGDARPYLKAIRASSGGCAYPAGELEGLSQFVQKKLARQGYFIPYLVGVSSGAAVARAALVQAPPNTFRGGLGLDDDFKLVLPQPFCKPHGSVSNPAATWHSVSAETLEASFVALTAQEAPPRPALAADVSDLPLVEIAATGAPADAFAVILSGDGGWASLDREVGEVLAARGIPVIGLDSLQYFWTRRTPDESANALERILRHALAARPESRAALIGYSRGADVLPFMVSRLPADLRKRVALVALLGPALSAGFEFHVSDWLGSPADSTELPVTPEIAKLHGLRVLCVYGHDEPESACRELDPALATRDERPGDHHFDGDYAAIGARIAQALAR